MAVFRILGRKTGVERPGGTVGALVCLGERLLWQKKLISVRCCHMSTLRKRCIRILSLDRAAVKNVRVQAGHRPVAARVHIYSGAPPQSHVRTLGGAPKGAARLTRQMRRMAIVFADNVDM